MSVSVQSIKLDCAFTGLMDAALKLRLDDDLIDDVDKIEPITKTGALIHPSHITAQVGSGCLQAAEAATNEILNPSFENNVTDGWNYGGGGAGGGVASSTDQAKVGDASAAITAGTGYVRLYSYVINVANGEDVTLSGFVYCDTALSSSNFQFFLYDNTNTTTRISLQTTLSAGSWHYLTGSWNNNTGGAVDVRVYCYNDFDDSSTVVYFDAIQVEKTAWPTPYLDGSLGTGHSWSGTAHNSTSSRTITELTYDNPLAAAPSSVIFGAWVRVLDADNNTSYPYILHWGDDGTNGRLAVFIDDGGGIDTAGKLYAGFIKDGETSEWVGSSSAISDDTWVHVIAYFTDVDTSTPDVQLYINGVSQGTYNGTFQITGLGTEEIWLGSYQSSGFELNGWLDDVVIMADQSVTADQAQAWYEYGELGIPFDGLYDDLWPDVTGDVAALRGIPANGPLDRVAAVGTLSFMLKNGQDNSGAALGYYTPDHTNVRTGWDLGLSTRLRIQYGGTWYSIYHGTIDSIDPVSGQYDKRQVMVRCTDFISSMSNHKMNLLTVQESLRSDQAIDLIVSNMDKQPSDVSYQEGQELFTYWGDDLKDERVTALGAARKVVISELGFLYINKDGELVFEDRHTRVLNTTADETLSNTDIRVITASRARPRIYNHVRAVTYPRDVGTSDELLLDMGSTPEIGADQSQTIRGRLRDPNLTSVRLSGKELWDPEGYNEIKDLSGGSDNRDFESSVGDWVADSYPVDGSETEEQSDEQAYKGSYSAKLTTGTDSGLVYAINLADAAGSLSQGDVLYFQVYVYLPSAWPEDVYLIVQEQEADDSFLANYNLDSMAKDTTGTWVRLSGSHTVVDALCDHVLISIGNVTNGDFSGGAVTLHIDEVYVIKSNNLLFEFSSSSTGGGDLNTQLDLTDTEQGANTVKFVLYNESTSEAGFVTKLQVKGKAVRVYEPITQISEDADSIDDYEKRPLSLILPYQDDPLVGKDFADYIKSGWKDPKTEVRRAEFMANTSSTLMDAALIRDLSDRVNLTEEMTGISADYVINGIEFTIFGKELIRCSWVVVLAGTEEYWLLGVTDYGELGEVTYLGF